MKRGLLMNLYTLLTASILSGCVANAATAQPEPTLLIHPNVGVPEPEMLIADAVRFETEDTPEGVVFDLDASIVLDGTITLVTSGLMWEIVETRTTGAFIDAQGRLTMPNDGRVWVVARLGTLESKRMPVWLDRSMPQLDPPPPPLRDPPPDVPTREEVKAAVEAARAALAAAGFPVNILDVVIGDSTFVANGETYTYWSGYGDMLPAGDDAIYMSSGLVTVNGNTYIFPDPIIVLTDVMADTLVNVGVFGPDGKLTNAGRLVLHELVHAVNDQMGIDLPGDLDEAVAEAMENELASKQVDIMELIREGFAQGELSVAQKNRLKGLIASFNATVQRIRDDAANDPDVTDAQRNNLDNLLKLFEWLDQDGDGFPDWLDTIIDLLFPNGLPDWLIFQNGPASQFPAETETTTNLP